MQNYYLLGSPIRHSLSPAMMNLSFSELGIDAEYGLMETDIDLLPSAVQKLKENGASGWNLTMPVKSAMCSLCDELSPSALIGQVVNTVVNRHGKLFGYTTDGAGFRRAACDAGFSVPCRKMVLLGTGGAASSILIESALSGSGEISVFCNRPSSRTKIEAVAKRLSDYSKTKIKTFFYSEPHALENEIRESSLLVNATNIGMAGRPEDSGTDCLIPDIRCLSAQPDVFDAIYNPRKTPLLNLAEKAGCRTANGLMMLLFQGAEAFRLWTDEEMPTPLVRKKIFPDS